MSPIILFRITPVNQGKPSAQLCLCSRIIPIACSCLYFSPLSLYEGTFRCLFKGAAIGERVAVSVVGKKWSGAGEDFQGCWREQDYLQVGDSLKIRVNGYHREVAF